MGDIGREGIERRWERHISMRDATVEWVHAAAERRNIDLGVVRGGGCSFADGDGRDSCRPVSRRRKRAKRSTRAASPSAAATVS